MTLPTLQMKDNFLNKEELNILLKNIDNIDYLLMSNKEGDFGFRHHFKKDKENEWLYKKIKKQFFPQVNLKPEVSSFHLRHNFKKVMSHTDACDYNFILYLKGKELIYNGTGFYYNNNLNTYVGFIVNRALFFNGRSTVHSDLQALGESSFRNTINIFYNYG